jgi:molecular chaperone GrpE
VEKLGTQLKNGREEDAGTAQKGGKCTPQASLEAEGGGAPREEEALGAAQAEQQGGGAGKENEKDSGEAPSPPEEAVAELSVRLEEAEARAQDCWNRLVRLQADFENYRKRSLREKEELLNFAAEELIRQLLPVLDNFELALASGRENPEGFFAGVEMIYRQLRDLLSSQGLKPVPALAEEFDPGRHEAVGWEEVPGEGKDNIIIKELRKGYFLKDKVLRPAMVVVARSAKPEDEVQEGEEGNG